MRGRPPNRGRSLRFEQMTERKRVLSRAGLVLVASIAASAFGVASAWAVTITEPSGSPVVAPVDPAGHLAPLPVSATGFPVRTAVYVEECDGTGPTMPRWDPTEHCDLASSPAAAYADANGSVTFSASRAFVPFVGESPQSLFNCLPNGSPSPSNGLPSFTNCQVRVSSNNSAVTADQRFFGLRLPANAANPPPRTTTTTTKPRAGVASNNVTTTTRMTAAVPRTGSKPAHGSTQTTVSAANTAAGGPANAAARATAAHDSSDSPGLLGLSDPAVAFGYLVFILGVAMTALSVRLARSRAALRRSPPR
jgi:hypothetical protein